MGTMRCTDMGSLVAVGGADPRDGVALRAGEAKRLQDASMAAESIDGLKGQRRERQLLELLGGLTQIDPDQEVGAGYCSEYI